MGEEGGRHLGAGGGSGEAEERRAGAEGLPLQWKTQLLERFLDLRHRWKRTAVKELNMIGIMENSCSIMFEG